MIVLEIKGLALRRSAVWVVDSKQADAFLHSVQTLLPSMTKMDSWAALLKNDKEFEKLGWTHGRVEMVATPLAGESFVLSVASLIGKQKLKIQSSLGATERAYALVALLDKTLNSKFDVVYFERMTSIVRPEEWGSEERHIPEALRTAFVLEKVEAERISLLQHDGGDLKKRDVRSSF